jgi:hypothetical protein
MQKRFFLKDAAPTASPAAYSNAETKSLGPVDEPEEMPRVGGRASIRLRPARKRPMPAPRSPAERWASIIRSIRGHDVRLQSWSYWSHRFAPLTASITLYFLWFLVVDAGQLIARVWMRLE